MKRGDKIVVCGVSGISGRYVGTRTGVQWICYDGQDYEAMCAAFDAL